MDAAIDIMKTELDVSDDLMRQIEGDCCHFMMESLVRWGCYSDRLIPLETCVSWHNLYRKSLPFTWRVIQTMMGAPHTDFFSEIQAASSMSMGDLQCSVTNDGDVNGELSDALDDDVEDDDDPNEHVKAASRIHQALQFFLAFCRQRNKNNLVHWASTETLALIGHGAKREFIKYEQKRRFAALIQHVERW